MRRFFTLGLLALMMSCLDESGVSPGSSSTFIRYYNGGNNDVANDLALATSGDGYVVLATTSIQKAEADTLRTKIKLIKTDEAGNPVWQRLYPGFTKKTRSYRGAAIQPVPGVGYIIAGDVIENYSDTTRTFVLLVDQNGVPMDSIDLDFDDNVSEVGRGIAINAAGNYLALSTQGTNKMIITEINKSDFSVVSTIGHASGQTDLASRLVVDETDKAVWSGVITNSGLKGVRFTKTVPANINTEFDVLLGNPGFSEVGNDFCKYGLIYALTGSTNRKADGTLGDTDIFYRLIDANGSPIGQTITFPIEGQNDIGNSINTTLDGGLIILSSALSDGIKGRGDTDFYMIKLDAFGNVTWTSAFGSRFKDEGTVALQTSDGGYVVLGTTTQGALKIVTLIKTDKNGKVQ
jgi:hypothetical protein